MDTKQRSQHPAAAPVFHQAAGLLLMCAVLQVASTPTQPQHAGGLLGIGIVDLAAAATVLALGRRRSRGVPVAWLLAPILLALVTATATAGYLALLSAPFYVLLIAWLGLHQSPRLVVAASALVGIAYAAAVSASGLPQAGIASALMLIPIAAAVGVVIAQHVRQLNVAREEIRAEERWRAALMATLAHDVRSPLTSISGVLEMLAEDVPMSPGHRELVAGAARQASRIRRLATGLLDVERVDQGRLRLDYQDVNLAEVAHEVAGSVGLGSSVVVDIPLGVSVWADRERIEQMLTNLVNNALRYGEAPIVISASSSTRGDTISVRDHGQGVPVEREAQVFQRLAPSDAQGSVGLGLWIVALLADAHEGSAEYRRADPGAEFLIHLPSKRNPEVLFDPTAEAATPVLY